MKNDEEELGERTNWKAGAIDRDGLKVRCIMIPKAAIPPKNTK